MMLDSTARTKARGWIKEQDGVAKRDVPQTKTYQISD